jgi:hypothetical protein
MPAARVPPATATPALLRKSLRLNPLMLLLLPSSGIKPSWEILLANEKMMALD